MEPGELPTTGGFPALGCGSWREGSPLGLRLSAAFGMGCASFFLAFSYLLFDTGRNIWLPSPCGAWGRSELPIAVPAALVWSAAVSGLLKPLLLVNS